jgi:hypothetical protein
VPTLRTSGERELEDMHAANAALASLMPSAQARVVLTVATAGLRPCLSSMLAPYGAWIEGGPLPAELRQEIDNWANSRPGRQIQQAAARVKAAASGSE